jgi:hypothetical protein
MSLSPLAVSLLYPNLNEEPPTVRVGFSEWILRKEVGMVVGEEGSRVVSGQLAGR